MSKVVASILTVALVGCVIAQDTFALKDHDRVVLYGDSITDNSPYGSFLDAYVAVRYPKLHVSFMNAGVGGDRVTGGWLGKIDDRFTRDLFSRQPTVITIMLGMNDASYRPFDQGIFDTYAAGYKHMAQRIKAEAPTARVWLIRPSAYDDVTRPPAFEGGYNGVLVKYGDFVQSLASENGFSTIDLNAPIVDMLTKAKAADAAQAAKLIGDRVHPGAATHLLMAAEIIKGWHGTPLVGRESIDWSTGKTSSDGASVKNWKAGSFDLTESSLPFPIDRGNGELALVLGSSNVASTLNDETLTVTGMPAGDYDLKIDGKVVGSFVADQFAHGIDLSALPTPMMAQAGHVFDLTGKIVAIRFNRWRMLEHGLDGIESDKAKRDTIASTQKLEEAMMAERSKAAQPVSHHFEIVPHAG